VEKGDVRFGVLPIENSAHGSVTKVYDLMRTHRFSIVRAVKLHIRHHLLAKKGTELSGVRVILSHEQAIGQCSRFLRELKDVQVRVCANTAMAAREVALSGEDGLAAISSEACASQYGLSILKSHIQNTDNNYTRFVCIAKEPVIYAGANRISMILTVSHTPGSLYRLLGEFAACEVNVLKLESSPLVGRDFEFCFYIDAEASCADPKIREMLARIKASCPEFVFLGNYAEV
jgi:chorismate mutase/prephenate dehydratase